MTRFKLRYRYGPHQASMTNWRRLKANLILDYLPHHPRHGREMVRPVNSFSAVLGVRLPRLIFSVEAVLAGVPICAQSVPIARAN